MLATDKKTQFSEDKVINCFILAASYTAARLLAGGQMVTCFAHVDIPANTYLQEDDATVTPDVETTLISLSRRMLDTDLDASTTADAEAAKKSFDIYKIKYSEDLRTKNHLVESGPLLNPAVAFGILMFKFNFGLSTF